MIYIDTSALVKKYVREKGTESFLRILAKEKLVLTSKLAYPETRATFCRKLRDGDMSRRELSSAWSAFLTDWSTFSVVEIMDELLPCIEEITLKYPLRGSDSVHVATALWTSRAIGEVVMIVASDSRILEAAKAEGLQTFNPENGSFG